VDFEWDWGKNERNRGKHGVSFEEARTVFHDPLARVFGDDLHSVGERREFIVGHSILHRLLLVCFVERSNRIRIISARRTNPAERKDYEENARA